MTMHQADLFGNVESKDKRSFWEKYLRSPQWKARRDARLRAVGYKCERCGINGPSARLEVHHLTYDRLGNELPSDLSVLCPRCHQEADAEREAREARLAKRRAKNAAYKTFCEKAYGYEGDEYPPDSYDRFEQWLERKEQG